MSLNRTQGLRGAVTPTRDTSGKIATSDIVRGVDGADGFSPIVEIAEVTGGHEITIVDLTSKRTVFIPDGEQGVQGTPGTDGRTPIKGIDYYTEDDKNEIVNAVLAALPNAEKLAF